MSTWICGVLLAQAELCDDSAVRPRGPAAMGENEVRGTQRKDEDEDWISGSAIRPSGPARGLDRLDRPGKVGVTATEVHCVVRFAEEENAIVDEGRGVAGEERISGRASQFAQRVDQ